MSPATAAGPRTVTVRDAATAEVLLRDPHLMTSAGAGGAPAAIGPGGAPTVGEFLGMWYTNQPDHPAVAAVLRRAFTARALDGFAAPCAEIAARQVAGLGPRGDLVPAYLSPALLHGLFTVLGMPGAEWPRIARATAVLVGVARSALGGAGAAPGAARAFDVVVRYLAQLTDQVLDGDGHTPFLAALREVAGRRAGRWPVVAVLGQVLMAGTEPMVVGAAQTCLRVWADPALRAGVRAGTADLAPVAEEVLRRSPPFPTLVRFVRETCACSGDRWPAGTVVTIDIAAVSDPAVSDTAVSDTAVGCPVRPASALTFGRGAHYCLGAAVARVQIPAVVTALAVGAPDLVVDRGGVRISDGGFLRRVGAFPYTRAGGR